MSLKPDHGVLRTIDRPSDMDNWRVPGHIAERITEFLLDRRTGNIKLNIRKGEILGAHVEEIVQKP